MNNTILMHLRIVARMKHPGLTRIMENDMFFGADMYLHIAVNKAFEGLSCLCIFVGPIRYCIPHIDESAGLNITMLCGRGINNFLWEVRFLS